MAICLENGSARPMVLNSKLWERLLMLGESYGWRPHGTRPPREFAPEAWEPFDYLSPDGQAVSREDAGAFAGALLAAAAELESPMPESILECQAYLLNEQEVSQILADLGQITGAHMRDVYSLGFGESDSGLLKQVARFCQSGLFEIRGVTRSSEREATDVKILDIR